MGQKILNRFSFFFRQSAHLGQRSVVDALKIRGVCDEVGKYGFLNHRLGHIFA